MKDIREIVAGNIRSIRKQKRMTQAELAEKAGISHQMVLMIETRKSWPRDQMLKAIAEALSLPSPAHLFATELPPIPAAPPTPRGTDDLAAFAEITRRLAALPPDRRASVMKRIGRVLQGEEQELQDEDAPSDPVSNSPAKAKR